jgi:LuxR family maltose regulon positive regulatory protein
MQPDKLLSAKLNIPVERRDHLARPRLTERLSAGLQRKVTLCSAPTGFGKTSLLSEWIRVSRIPAAWLSLDAHDNESVRFLSYLIAALQTIKPMIGQDILTWLQTPSQLAGQASTLLSEEWEDRVLTSLVNDITATPGTFVLVLDDYHMIESPQIHEIIGFLNEHSPAYMHLVIASRSDPPLPIARLRARRQLNELRETDLRCTADETLTLLNQVMRLGLAKEDVAALEARTEGWIAGLQLAAQALQPLVFGSGKTVTPDPTIAHNFIKDFSGSHRYVLDYLVDEVLSRQPEHVQQFLFQTSILENMSGELCDAVTNRKDSQATLEGMERLNLFLVPLDGERHWYRYHSLFADLLRHRLEDTLPNQIHELHRRASEWYASKDRVYEAVGHALSAKDYARAAGLIETAGPIMAMRGEAANLLAWMDALPDHAVQARPRLSLTYAWTLFVSSNLGSIEPRLQDALKALDAVPLQAEGLLIEVAILRAIIAVYQGNAKRAIDLCIPVLSHTPETSLARCGICSVLGDAYLQADRLDEASRSYEEALRCGIAIGNPILSMISINDLARLKIEQGKLHEASQLFRQVLDWGGNQRAPLYPVGQAYVGMGGLVQEWNEFEAAESHLRTGVAYCERGGYTRYAMLGNLSLARIMAARGDTKSMLDLVGRAEQLAKRTGVQGFTSRVAAQRVRLWLMPTVRNITPAFEWLSSCGIHPDDQPHYSSEFEYLTLARVLIAQNREHPGGRDDRPTLRLLDQLLHMAESAGRTQSVIEVLVLSALAWQASGELDKAIDALERALAVAEPENYLRLFLDEGSLMATLLRMLVSHQVHPEYATRLLREFDQRDSMGDGKAALGESLTEREMQVLRLLAAGMSNSDIADHLVITLTTVKAHARNIFRKLDVENRTQAASRARELNLL